MTNDISIGVVIFWEVSLKCTLAKLELQGITAGDLPEAAAHMGFDLLLLPPEDAATFLLLKPLR